MRLDDGSYSRRVNLEDLGGIHVSGRSIFLSHGLVLHKTYDAIIRSKAQIYKDENCGKRTRMCDGFLYADSLHDQRILSSRGISMIHLS